MMIIQPPPPPVMPQTHTVYMPLIISNLPTVGVHLEGPNTASQTKYVPNNAYIVVPAYWYLIETAPGAIDWTDLDARLEPLADWHVIVNLRTTPAWARSGLRVCDPPTPEHYTDYAAIALRIADRYPHVNGFELYNEPDATDPPPAMQPLTGCWSSGAQYGEFVRRVAPALKQRRLLVFAGALCDVTTWARDFIAWAGEDYDYVSYHAYPHVSGAPPATLAFSQAAKLMQWTDKPLALTETSMLYDEPSEQAEQIQADYLEFLLANMQSFNIQHVSWYALLGNGWLHSDLIEAEPKPAFYVWHEAGTARFP